MDKNQNRIKSVIFIVESFGRKSSKQPRPRIISTITFEINVAWIDKTIRAYIRCM